MNTQRAPGHGELAETGFGRVSPSSRHGARTRPEDRILDAFAEHGLQDIHAPHAAHTAFVHALLRERDEPLVWVQDARTRADTGCVWGPIVRERSAAERSDVEKASNAAGRSARARRPKAVETLPRLVVVRAGGARDVLWAMEEAVKAGVAAVGEVSGAPAVLDLTATRRLDLFARGGQVPCLLVRIGQDASGGASAARRRWRIGHAAAPIPSAASHFADAREHFVDAREPGPPRWVLDLVRARDRPPGRWSVEARPDERDPQAHRLHVAAALADGDVAARATPREPATVLRFPPEGAAAGRGTA